jgi:hypothetical protein
MLLLARKLYLSPNSIVTAYLRPAQPALDFISAGVYRSTLLKGERFCG